MRGLLQRMESDAQSVLDDLEELRSRIVARPGAIIDCTAEAQGLTLVEAEARQLLRALPPHVPVLKRALAARPLICPRARPLSRLPRSTMWARLPTSTTKATCTTALPA